MAGPQHGIRGKDVKNVIWCSYKTDKRDFIDIPVEQSHIKQNMMTPAFVQLKAGIISVAFPLIIHNVALFGLQFIEVVKESHIYIFLSKAL